MATTPRQVLDFIQNSVRLYNEKRSELEEEQLHINVGLNEIAETEAQGEEGQKSLAVKSTKLETKNKEAEKQTQPSIEISQLVDKQTKEIPIRKAEVGKDMERVEPSVIDAQNAGKSNKKQHTLPQENVDPNVIQHLTSLWLVS